LSDGSFTVKATRPVFYARYMLIIAGIGGLLYGIDIGIISAALLYLNKTIDLSVQQTSLIVAAVLGGSMLSSPIAGFLADWVGRKRLMILGGLLFVTSVGMIVLSQGFASLFIGRLLQGLSGGVIAVAVPLFLAESLSAETRGRGTSFFQFMLTVGIVFAALAGFFYTHQAELTIALAHGDRARILAAENHAWRGMFLSMIYPGILFFLGSLFLSETPRWLFRQGRREEAFAVLSRNLGKDEAELEMAEMEMLAGSASQPETNHSSRASLLQRRYVIPFILACAILGLNQTTGISTLLGFLVIILRQAGMSATHATSGDVVVKLLNVIMTVAAMFLIDRRGRRFLLKIGTGIIVLSLLGVAVSFYTFESRRVDVTAQVQRAIAHNDLTLPITAVSSDTHLSGPQSLTVIYDIGDGSHSETVLSTDTNPTLAIHADPGHTLNIRRAALSPVPSQRTGWIVAAFLAIFVASYAVGPGVVVWLMLSELMPTRIRSAGMGIALLINQGASAFIASAFLPLVSWFGYYSMFLFLAACTSIYFLIAAFALPETKGKSLEEIEMLFERNKAVDNA
jgi:SP family myo-inositol transporter-like MFS transporter 13